jgi:hypothetical protein
MGTMRAGLSDMPMCTVGVQLSSKMGVGPNDLSISVTQLNGVD